MKLPIITMQIISWRGPCINPRRYAGKSWSGTALKVLRHPAIRPEHKLWVALHESALPRQILVEAARLFVARARAVSTLGLTDLRSGQVAMAATAAAFAYEAAKAAAYAHEVAAYVCEASAYATQAAAYSTSATISAERKEQVNILVRLCQEYESCET